MSKVNFIIYTLIYMTIAVLLTFKIGPDIIKGGKSINTKPFQFTKVEKIDLWYHKVGEYYLNVKIIADSKPIEFQFYTPDKNYNPIANLLKSNYLISGENTFLETIPISFKANQLTFIKKVELLYDKKNSIQYLAINNNVIKGSKPTFRKAFTIFLGYLLTTISGLGLLMLPMGAYYQIKDNIRRGTTIYVPNSLDGIKNFLKLFTNK
ncbi:hypothetical protein BZARG_2797 [Bizionia argentinensis JUB59]|uniref:Uncharacterized protein n=1 Tax=Bizionia argentinensis JUB59 TaxID=1046627 RepID=G2EFI5_9FLAO|nr:hypothetical protein [Bizionia argentinensis]EGV42803.1 hypothetical protein BZARG_2797 [Bizionia argentinensis JUB59]